MKDQCYEFVKGANNKVSIVGFGSYGQVKLAKNTQTGQIVAIKMIHGRNAKDQIDVHHKLNHPRIIRLINYYYQKQKNMTYMVLQYAEGGTLHNKIKFGYGQLPKEKVKKYFKDICKAVQYLHSLKYMHRDIKPENILLTKDDHAKLCDFGFAAILEYRSTLCGTYQYMAPQMIQEKPYDYKVDIWALGILLFQLIQGAAPFRGQNGQDVINQMKKPIVFSNRFQKQQIDLIKKILRVNAENRPNATSILQHPYIAESNVTQKALSNLVTQQNSRAGSNTNMQQNGQKLKSQYITTPSINQQLLQIKADEKLKKNQAKSTNNVYQANEFQYFVPPGVKNNINLNYNKPHNSHITITNPHQSYQSFNAQNASTSNNPNSSIDSTTYRQQQTNNMPSFLTAQKNSNPATTKPNSNNYITQPQMPNFNQISPPQNNQNRPTNMATYINRPTGQINPNSNIWKKS